MISDYGRHGDRRSRHEKYSGTEQDNSGIRERERDRSHHHRDDHRDRSKKDDRGRDRIEDSDRRRSRDYDRSRDHHRERERRDRHRSHSRSKDKSRNRSKSRSPSRSKRTSGFDMAPAAPQLPGAAFTGQLPGFTQPIAGTMSAMLSLATPQFASMSLMPQAMTQQATRHARRVYVGGLPPLAIEQTIATFFSQVMTAIGGNSAGAGAAVVSCQYT